MTTEAKTGLGWHSWTTILVLTTKMTTVAIQEEKITVKETTAMGINMIEE
jgi:hypothetical protein